MFCKYCGHTLEASAMKCGRCGRQQPAKSDCGGFYNIMPGAAPRPEETHALEQPAKKQPDWVTLVLAVLLLGALILSAVQGGRISSLEEQLDGLKEEISELGDELREYRRENSRQEQTDGPSQEQETVPVEESTVQTQPMPTVPEQTQSQETAPQPTATEPEGAPADTVPKD